MQEMQEAWVQSLGQKDSLEEGTATHSSILTWESHEQRSLMGYNPWDHKRAGHDLETKQQQIKFKIKFYCVNLLKICYAH